MIRITCPKCRKPCEVGDEWAGRLVRCPACQEGIIVSQSQAKPPQESIFDAAPAKPRQQPPALPRPQRSARSRRQPTPQRKPQRAAQARRSPPAETGASRSMIGWIIGGGVLAVVLVGGAAFFILSQRDSDGEGNENQQAQNQAPAHFHEQPANPIQPKQIPEPAPQKPLAHVPPVEQPPIEKPVEPIETPQPAPKDPAPSPKPLPDRIAADTVRAVKQATVYLRVASATGQTSEGSGFFAVEPGIVITNAHVLGMLNKNSRPPSKVDVVVHSGEPNELRLTGSILGVDRDCDLAVIRVQGDLPKALLIDAGSDLVETQQVFIFGFPLGAQLGKNITVAKSSISSLRKDKTGALRKIQVNGGMHPGNSGGPVVNSAGKVVGVSVAGIPGTQIQFAIPAQFVKLLLAGRLMDSHYGTPFATGDLVQVPAKYTCLDPFGRIRQMSVEVWAGNRGASRPFSLRQPAPRPGDGPRATQTIQYVGGAGSKNIVLPRPGPGKVAWIQPVLVNSNGVKQWGPASAIDPSLAVVRKSANLVANVKSHRERTVRLNSRSSFSLIKGDKKLVMADNTELEMLESFDLKPRDQGMLVKTGFGPLVLTTEDNGQVVPVDARVRSILGQIPPVFIVDDTNRLRVRSDRNLSRSLPFTLRDQVKSFYSEICNAYEACNLIYPNRSLRPGEEWPTKMPMLLKMPERGGKAIVADLILTCVYEGARMRNGEQEALVRVSGRVEGRDTARNRVDGRVRGEFTFNVAKGYIALAEMTITTESNLGDDIQMVAEFDVDLKRQLGNPKNLVAPERKTAAPPSGKIISQVGGKLSPTDPLDTKFANRGSRVKIYPLRLRSGQRYIIDVTSSSFDTYIRLMTPDGRRVITENDDGAGNLNSRIIFTPNVNATFRLAITSFNGRTGPYQIVVRQQEKRDQGGNRPPGTQR